MEESLEIACCPLCGGEVDVADCGYSSFNPGFATCQSCKRKWLFRWVADRWELAQLWNKKAAEIRERLLVLSFFKIDYTSRAVRRFTKKEIEATAKTLLAEFEAMVIGDDKERGR